MAAKPTTKPKAVAYTDTYEGKPAIFVSGFIFDGFGLFLADYLAEEAKRAGQTITLFLQSGGGLVTEAFAFYDFVRAHSIDFRVEGYGEVGSAATIIALAAGRDKIALAENAAWFMHRAYMVNEWGDRIDGNPEELARINGQLASIYATESGRSEEEIIALLDKGDRGASLSAQEAVDMGFAGGIVASARAAAFRKPQAVADTDHTKTMSKTTVAVKLPIIKALASAIGQEVTAEVNIDEAVAAQLSEKDQTIDELKKQIETLEASRPAEGVTAEKIGELTGQLQAAQAEASAKAQALAAKEQEFATISAELAELKKPLAERTNADNRGAAVAAMPGSESEHPNVVALRKALASDPRTKQLTAKA
jgi:ATP-dependent Clp protease, protease subunit